ncbi:hypothetical protein FYC62_14275 [Pedobacter aquae]|uniref:Invasin domain-containing protein n=1 Tax=Pedobacter aquae TaxID=2605747 RepID=A0A5C0VJK5_9SPHI|nr:hypothetical protein FYC62_14275 [Pedobacter aquae]
MAQTTTEVSVPFNNGAIGVQGTNPQKLNNLQNFQTLLLSKAYFIQNSSTSQFFLQGNDIPGTLRLITNTNQILDIQGAIVWREANNPNFIGFVPSPASTFSINLNAFGGANYVITQNSNFALQFNNKTFSFINGSNLDGNAAMSSVLSDLNAYLATTNSLKPSGPVTVLSQTTSSTTPTITGVATLAAGQSLTVVVNNVLYSASNGLVVNNGNWSLAIPSALPLGTYSVTATITNTDGYILSDVTSNELVITAPSTEITVSDISVTESNGYGIFTVQGPANSFVSLFLNDGTARGLGVDYGAIASQTTLGLSSLEVSRDNGATWTVYKDFIQLPSSFALKVRTPINDDNIAEVAETFRLVVKPIAVNLATTDLYDVNYNTINLSGLTLISGAAEAVNAVYGKTNAITINSQAIDVRVTIVGRSNIGTAADDFVFDEDATNNTRFQSELNSTNSAGSFIDYRIQFFRSGTTTPVALTNFFVTGVDVDGASLSVREYIELSNFSSYTVNNPTGLTVGVSPANPNNTRFTGLSNSLSGIVFENTASFIANYQSPLTELNFRKGITGAVATARQFSVSFGEAIGTFTNPSQTANDDSKISTATITDNDADATKSTIAANPIAITANGISTSTITVQLKDISGNNLTTSGVQLW